MILHIVIIIIAGAAGGWASWILSPSSQIDTKGMRYGAVGYIIVGIIAAFLVPLFLSMAQSDLINQSLATNSFENALIFGGFCIVAGFSARAFITSISERLLSQLEEKTEEQEDQLEEIRDNLEEAGKAKREPHPEFSSDEQHVKNVAASLNSKQQLVLRNASRLTMRTVTGISKDSSLKRSETSEVLETLIRAELMERTTSSSGNLRFKVTPLGIEVVNALDREN